MICSNIYTNTQTILFVIMFSEYQITMPDPKILYIQKFYTSKNSIHPKILYIQKFYTSGTLVYRMYRLYRMYRIYLSQFLLNFSNFYSHFSRYKSLYILYIVLSALHHQYFPCIDFSAAPAQQHFLYIAKYSENNGSPNIVRELLTINGSQKSIHENPTSSTVFSPMYRMYRKLKFQKSKFYTRQTRMVTGLSLKCIECIEFF